MCNDLEERIVLKLFVVVDSYVPVAFLCNLVGFSL